MKPLAFFFLLLACLGPSTAQAIDAEPAKEAAPATEMPGAWIGFHPDWTGLVVCYPDGTLIRPHIGHARWELATKDASTHLVILWTGFRPVQLKMITPDHFRQDVTRGAFEIFRVPPAADKLPAQDANAPGTAKTKALLDNTTWRLLDRKNIFLNENGNVACNWDDRPGTWKMLGPQSIEFDVPWSLAPAKIVTLNRDASVLRWSEDEHILATRKEK